MTLKPPYLGRTLKDVPPTDTLTKPRVVMMLVLVQRLPGAAVGCRGSVSGVSRTRRRVRAAVNRRWLVLRRAGQPSRRPAGQFLSHQLNPTSSVAARHTGRPGPPAGAFRGRMLEIDVDGLRERL